MGQLVTRGDRESHIRETLMVTTVAVYNQSIYLPTIIKRVDSKKEACIISTSK